MSGKAKRKNSTSIAKACK